MSWLTLRCCPVTAGSPGYLRSLPLKQLQAYIKAYGLTAPNAIEKEDFVQAILKAKSPHNGCLSPEREVGSCGMRGYATLAELAL